ncbi:MAG: hypothetical protein EBX40_00630 [Gammaproteobacteria bacterium]|nr:hypothetical protein [Gammaproteobacteria bacterium]
MITLGQYAAFYTKAGKQIDTDAEAANQLPEPQKSIMLSKLNARRAVAAMCYFTENTDTGKLPLAEVLDWYHSSITSQFTGNLPEGITLPPHELHSAHCNVTFGQFIDAKLLVQAARESNKSVWQLAVNLCAVFARFSVYQNYTDVHASEDGPKHEACLQLPLIAGVKVLDWWNSLNTYIGEHFAMFDETDSSDAGPNIKEHMKHRGWLRFQNSIAESKLFDIPGSKMNSIACCRAAKLVDVLSYADEKQGYNLSQNEDLKLTYNKT